MKRLQLRAERCDISLVALPLQQFLSGVGGGLRGLAPEPADTRRTDHLTLSEINEGLYLISLFPHPSHDVVISRREQTVRPDELLAVGKPEESSLHPQIQITRELHFAVQHSRESHDGISLAIAHSVAVCLQVPGLGSVRLPCRRRCCLYRGIGLNLGRFGLLLGGGGRFLRRFERLLRALLSISGGNGSPNRYGSCNTGEDQQADLHRKHQRIVHARTLSGVTR